MAVADGGSAGLSCFVELAVVVVLDRVFAVGTAVARGLGYAE